MSGAEAAGPQHRYCRGAGQGMRASQKAGTAEGDRLQILLGEEASTQSAGPQRTPRDHRC